MSALRTADQRAAFVRSAAAELDVAPELAEGLLALSEAARQREGGPLDPVSRRRLLGMLADDELCRHAWWVAGAEGERLWWDLLADSDPPARAGPAVLLAVALAARGACGHAFDLVRDVLGRSTAPVSVLELGIDLAEDAGCADLAWTWAERLHGPRAGARWPELRDVADVDRSAYRGEGAVPHARWLRRRLHRWQRRRWSPLPADPDPYEGTAVADPVAAAALDYLHGRRGLLPPRERDLLAVWTRAARAHYPVVRAGRRAVVLDVGGRPRFAGRERPDDGPYGPVVDGWLLPTLAAGRVLFVDTSRPPTPVPAV